MMATRVYRYGLLAPAENGERVRAQMRAAHTYRNTLTAIERGRRDAVRDVLATAGDVPALELAALRAMADEEHLAVRVRKAKADARASAGRIDPTLREALATARVVRRDAVRALADARRAQREDPAVVEACAAVHDRAGDLCRNARAHCGVHWGTYLVIEAAMAAACKAPLYDGAAPNDPRFVRWTGDGFVAVQVRGDIGADELHAGSDTRVQITLLPPRDGSRRAARRRMGTLRLRVGSHEDRSPLWASWPVLMHRPLPAEARITWARVQLRRIGPREEWSLLLTVNVPDPVVLDPAEPTAVGVDLGWRVMPGHLRIARWRGTDGETGEVALARASETTPHDELHRYPVDALAYPSTLRAIRDDRLEVIRETLVRALERHRDVLPEWLRQATRTLGAWRSHARFAALARRWSTHRWEGDDAMYKSLEAWRYKDHHLWAWEASQRTKALRRRKDIYRVHAAQLAERYDVLVIEKMDLREFAKRPAAEQVTEDNARARAHRQLVAPSDLRAALVQAFTSRAKRVVEVPARDTTRTCHGCGSEEQWDQAAQVEHQCSQCGRTWDQDDNAAAMLLAWRTERGAEKARPQRKVGGRFAGKRRTRAAAAQPKA